MVMDVGAFKKTACKQISMFCQRGGEQSVNKRLPIGDCGDTCDKAERVGGVTAGTDFIRSELVALPALSSVDSNLSDPA